MMSLQAGLFVFILALNCEPYTLNPKPIEVFSMSKLSLKPPKAWIS